MTISLKRSVLGMAAAAACTVCIGQLAQAHDGHDGVPPLDHVFVIVLENHNINQIIGNPQAPHITALSQKYNLATNYNGVWHPSLPNYAAMITGDWIGTDVIGNSIPSGQPGGHTYPPNSVVGISDDDSPSVATDYPVPPALASFHRWTINLPSLAGQLVNAGKDWRAYLQNIPEAGTHIANWPGDVNTAKLYAVKHNPFPYVAEVQNDPAQFAKQVPLEQLFSDLGTKNVPALSYIVPDQCRDMHGLGNILAPCGGVNDTDDNDVKRGDDETYWLVNGILGSSGWRQGRNVIFVVFDEGNGPLTCNYNPDTQTDVVPGTLLPGPDCYAKSNFNDPVVMIAITNFGKFGVQDPTFYSHYSLLRTIEAGFGLPYLGHAGDATTKTMSVLLAAEDD